MKLWVRLDWLVELQLIMIMIEMNFVRNVFVSKSRLGFGLQLQNELPFHEKSKFFKSVKNLV